MVIQDGGTGIGLSDIKRKHNNRIKEEMKGICTFCGHAQTPDHIKSLLKEVIEELISSGKADTFYVGSQGQFGRMALSVLRELKETYSQIQYAIVLAYIPGARTEYDDDTPTIYPEGLELVPKKFAIVHRNRWMVAQSEYLIAYVQHSWGGAAQTLTYAKRRGVNISNLANQ